MIDVNDAKNMYMMDAVIENDVMFFSHKKINALIAYDLKKDKVLWIHKMEKYGVERFNLFLSIIKYKNYIVMGPDTECDDIYLFDIESKAERYFRIESGNALSDIIPFEEKIVFIPNRIGGYSYELDMSRMEIKKSEIWERVKKSILKDLDIEGNTWIKCYINESKLWIVLSETGYLIEIDYEKESFIIHRINGLCGKAVAGYNESIYISDKITNDVIKYNLKEQSKSTVATNVFIDDFIFSMIATEEFVFASSRFGHSIARISVSNNRVDMIDCMVNGNEFPIKSREKFPFYNYKMIENKNDILVLPLACKDMLAIDKSKLNIKNVNLSLEAQYIEKIMICNMKEKIQSKLLIRENEEEYLNIFAKAIVEGCENGF